MNFNAMQMQNVLAQMQQQRKPLVEFRAGVCNFSLADTKVTPDKRKGKVVITQNPSGEINFQWKLRPSNTVDWHRLLLPKSATWETVPECTTGRCFLLRFKHGTAENRLKFFWMQEPKDEKDDEYLKKINDIIENPPPPPSNPMAGMSQAQLMNMLGGGQYPGTNQHQHQQQQHQHQQQQQAFTSTNSGGSGNNAAATNANPDRNYVDALQHSLRDFLRNQPKSNLNDVLDAERVMNALDEDDMKRLFEFLPESQRDLHNLRATLRCPQIQQTNSRLSAILNGPEFNAMMASMNLPHTGASVGVSAFLDSIQTQADKAKATEKKKDEDSKSNDDSNKKSDN